jgi:hypothetical protein
MQIIPLTTAPNQEFDITLPVDGNNINLHFKVNYNEIAGYWVMELTNNETSEVVLSSVPLITGENLLAQYEYLGIGSAYVKRNGSSSLDYPDHSTLGDEFVLVWGDTGE